MEKNIIDRRLEILIAEGIEFRTSIEVGKDISTDDLKKQFDAIIICVGASIKRNLPIPGSDLKGVIQAMDFLPNSNKFVDKQLTKPTSTDQGTKVTKGTAIDQEKGSIPSVKKYMKKRNLVAPSAIKPKPNVVLDLPGSPQTLK